MFPPSPVYMIITVFEGIVKLFRLGLKGNEPIDIITLNMDMLYSNKEESYVFRLDLCGAGDALCSAVPVGKQQR